MNATSIYPQLVGLKSDDAVPSPQGYQPLFAALAKNLVLFLEDPDDDEGHRYCLFSGGPKPDQNYGILIFARYFADDPGIEDCEDVEDVQAVCRYLCRRVHWVSSLTAAVGYVRTRLANAEANHRDTGRKFLEVIKLLAPNLRSEERK